MILVRPNRQRHQQPFAANLMAVTAEADRDPGLDEIVLAVSAKAFATEADVREIARLNFRDVAVADWFAE